ncbi:hypothetical protein, partial [Escherichia coli]
KIVWKTQKASDLLNQYLPELEGFEAGLKAWFSDLEHEKDPKKLTSCSYSTPSQQLQLLLLTPWETEPSVAKNYLIQIKTSTPALEMADILKYCP